MPGDLKLVDGAEAGAWIAPRLEGGSGGKVMQQVPNGYGAYVRILHPAFDLAGNPVPWATVAERLGRTVHREVQWHKLVGSSDSEGMADSEWPGSNPDAGLLEPPVLEALCKILAVKSPGAAHFYFGLSAIWGGVESTYPEAKLLREHDRDYVVFSGPLSAVGQLGYEHSGAVLFMFSGPESTQHRIPQPDRWTSQSPSLIWPTDHSWFLANDVDLDSTLVGGTRDLIDAILASPELETWEVGRGDSLEADADKIN